MNDDAKSLMQIADQLPLLLGAVQRNIGRWLESEHVGTANDGQIVAVVSATGKLVSVSISPLSKRRLDNLTLGDAITEAIVNAEQEARRAKSSMFGDMEIAGMRVSDIMEHGPAAAAQKLIGRGEP